MNALSSRNIAIALSFALLCALAVLFAQGLSIGKNLDYDEFYSLERSAGFEKYSDWLSVYSSNERSARKPPLQYWFNAICLKAGMPELLSFRLSSYFFLLGSIIVTSLLCFHFSKGNYWALPAGILLTGCSSELLLAGRSAMLDAGLCFFMLCALLGFFYAKQNPKWWIFCSLSIGLGALQKAPVGFLFVMILLTTLNAKKDVYYNWKHLRTIKYFNQSIWLTLLLLLSWPLLQTFRFGYKYIDLAVRREMLKRISPIGDDRINNMDFLKWTDWVWDDIHIAGVMALICIILVFSVKKLRSSNALFALSVLVGVISLSLSLASGKIYPRYVVALSPLLIVLSVKVISDLVPWKPAPLILALLTAVTGATRSRATLDIITRGDTFTRSKNMVSLLDSYRAGEDRVFIDRGFLSPGAYGYFSTNTYPFSSRFVETDRRRTARAVNTREFSLIGITSFENEQRIQSIADGYIRLYADQETLVWKFEKPNDKD